MAVLKRAAALFTAVLLVSGGGLLAAGSARAADPGPSITAAGTYYIPTPDVDLESGVTPFIFYDRNADGSTPAMSHVTIDASALAGKVELHDIEDGCTHVGLLSTCELNASHTDPQPFSIQALDYASLGFSADIVLTLTVAGFDPVTTHVHAIVGTPSLQAQPIPTRTGVEPGTEIPVTAVIGNKGQVATSKGFALTFFSEPYSDPDARGFDLAGPRYSNCHYQPAPGTKVICFFTQDIAPGTAYEVSAPVTYKTRPALMMGTVRYSGGLNDTYVAVPPSGGPGFPDTGDGPPLTLAPTTIDKVSDDGGYGKVVADQYADYQAIGAALTGKPGDEVTVSVGVRNAGPGVLANSSLGGFYEITLPEGVTLMSDAPCDPWTKPANTYRCITGSSSPVGFETTVRLTIRLDRAVDGAVGSVKVIQPLDYENGGTATHDPDPGNDVAPITVDITGTATPTGEPTGTGGPTPSGTATTTAPPATTTTSPAANGGVSGGNSGGAPAAVPPAEGSLASTGSTGTLPVAAAAAAALLIGTVAFVSVRRRRGARR